jgi:hypothetical protein
MLFKRTMRASSKWPTTTNINDFWIRPADFNMDVFYMYKIQENTPSPSSFPMEEKLYLAVWASLVIGMMYMIQTRKL